MGYLFTSESVSEGHPDKVALVLLLMTKAELQLQLEL